MNVDKIITGIFLTTVMAWIVIIATIVIAGITYGSNVTFTWDNPEAADLAGIRLYQSEAPFDPNNVIPDVSILPDPNARVAEISDFSAEQYTLTGVGDGHYWWAATAFDVGGNESGYSNQVDAVIDATPPDRPTIDIEVIVRVRVQTQ